MEVRQSGNVILTRWYSSSGYIKETSGGVTKEYTFIGGDAYSAPCVSVRQQGGSNRFYYLIRDHLGSIIQVSDSTAGSLYEYNYDAWGRLRNPTNWSYYSSGTEPSLFIAGRGFTGHEHLPWFNLINMNGRLYDPLTGQFLSPDSNVQLPDFTQNFNRYSYCLNNPLKYKDQNGEWVITALTMLANMWVSTSAVNNWQFNPVKWDWKSVKTWSSLVQSGISGYKMGSSLEYKLDKIIHKSYYDNLSKKIVNDFNSRFEIPRNRTSPNGYMASLDGFGSSEFYSFGSDEPFLTKQVYNSADDWYGRSELRLNVHGSMYERYNWIQTVSSDSPNQQLDTQFGGFHGFYYNKAGIDTWRPYVAEIDADMFFQDRPNAGNFFKAELTLCGKRGELWYPIRTFSWGFSINNGVVDDYFYSAINVSSFHFNSIVNILGFMNLNPSLYW